MKIISIIIATYNASSTIERCLKSIIPQLTEECELIIIDGESSDKTNSIIETYDKYIAKYISEPDRGIYDAWNKGIEISEGEWIMFIGADDILLPNAIKSYLDFIKIHLEMNVDYICAHNEYVDSKGNLLKVLGENAEWQKMRYKMSAAHVASLHNKKKLFDTIGYYDLKYKICGDYELLLRKKNNLNSVFIPMRIAKMEMGGMSFSFKAIYETYLIRKEHRSISLGLNRILFLKDILTCYFFYFRKSILKN